MSMLAGLARAFAGLLMRFAAVGLGLYDAVNLVRMARKFTWNLYFLSVLANRGVSTLVLAAAIWALGGILSGLGRDEAFTAKTAGAFRFIGICLMLSAAPGFIIGMEGPGPNDDGLYFSLTIRPVAEAVLGGSLIVMMNRFQRMQSKLDAIV
jgi:hypothetical protein